MISPEKMIRLEKERHYLYEKHPRIGCTDPFYNRNLVDCKSTYEPNLIYDFEKRKLLSSYKKLTKPLKDKWQNSCVKFEIDEVTERDGIIYLEGWSFVMQSDNNGYKKSIIIRNTQDNHEQFAISVFERYRDDVAGSFPEEKNIALSGVVCHIPITLVKKEMAYTITILIKAKYSRQILYKEYQKCLYIGKDNRIGLSDM